MLITKVSRLLTILGGAALSAACVPPHYSVGVARGPTHITYAQRHHDAHQTDYLVDCELDADGEPTEDCSVVKLEAE